MIKNILGAFCALALLGSCAPREKLQYYQGIAEAVQQETAAYNPILKQDDLLFIRVSAPNPEAARDFNLTEFSVIGDGSVANRIPDVAVAQQRLHTYLIDREGMIDFPVLGRIQLGGLTRAEAMALLNGKLQSYINDPIITMRILNYKVTVQGEVVRPGVFTTNSERITLPEALAMAGDLTIYGKRENILIIREIDGKKSHHFVDITKADFINSPFYYLSQNDVVYVEPNKMRINSSAVGPNVSVILTSVSLVITIIALLIR